MGKAALKVFVHSSVQVVTTSSILDEVREYIPRMAEAYGMVPQLLEGQLQLLAIEECPRESYQHCLGRAARRIERRDPDDVELLALALALDIPVWSNDRDFERTGVQWFTTARLLKALGL